GRIAARHLDRLCQGFSRRSDLRVELVAGQDLAGGVGPVFAEDRLHLRRYRTGGPHHRVAPLLGVAGVAEPVVGDAEAAGEAHRAVDDQDLAVRPPTDLVNTPEPDGMVDVDLGARLLHAVEDSPGVAAAGAVHQHAHLDAAPRGVDQ